MKKKSKRLLATLLAVAMTLCTMQVAFAAQETVQIGNTVYMFKLHHGTDGYPPQACFATEGYCIRPYTAHPSTPSGGSKTPTDTPEQIDGYPVVCLRYAYKYEKTYPLTTVPTAIPQYVQDLSYAYLQQPLAALPTVIPDMVVSMENTFALCTGIRAFPTIGKSVENMKGSFDSCANITGTITLPPSVTNLASTFKGCAKMSEIPDISQLNNLTELSYTFSGCTVATGGTDLPKTPPTNLASLFSGCTMMTTPPKVIPANVTTTSYMFNQCEALSGTIDVRASISSASPTKYTNMFAAAATAPGTQLTLNYTAENESAIDDIIAKKPLTSHIVKGVLLGAETPDPEPPVDPVPPVDPEPTPDPDPTPEGGFELTNGKGSQEVTIEGIVEPVNALDVDIPIRLQFIIDEARNLTCTTGAKVTSRSPAPLVVTCKSVTVPSGAPALVADNAFVDWDNLNTLQAHGNLALSLNGKNLSTPNVVLGNIASGFGSPTHLPITMGVLYGKQWVNTGRLVFDYSMNMELALAN